ncbi:MAG: hypothetical protein M1825_002202 [Sarcosagium campestre]|nr:MAG: hypothetical protein M1825_002202 [Sarcosagium campestre]
MKVLLLIATVFAFVADVSSLAQYGKCPPNFRNVVFNAAVNIEPNWPNRFNIIQSYGIDKWIGFTLFPAGNANVAVNRSQLRIVMNPSQVADAVKIVTAPNPPDYLEIFNEPDIGGFGNPVTSPEQAARDVVPLLKAKTRTKYLSPAPALGYTDWLPRFFKACKCLDRFAAVTMHVYRPDPDEAIEQIRIVHKQFPNKKIWITEISPASQQADNCKLRKQGMINWMNQVLGWAARTGYVDRVFWNCGEYGTLYPDDPNRCNPSLTNNDTLSTPTDLLRNYGRLC